MMWSSSKFGWLCGWIELYTWMIMGNNDWCGWLHGWFFLGEFTDEWLMIMCMHLCMARIRCTSVWYNRLFVFSLPPLSPNPIPSPFLSPFLFLTFLSIYLCSASVSLSVFNPCRKGLNRDRRRELKETWYHWSCKSQSLLSRKTSNNQRSVVFLPTWVAKVWLSNCNITGERRRWML